jgi:tight adherence protein C
MPYLISATVALAVGLMVLALGRLLLVQANPSKSRLMELGLGDAYSKDAAARRKRTGKRVKQVLVYLGHRLDTPTRSWISTKQRLVQAGFQGPLALPTFLGGRLAAAGLLYLYGFVIAVGVGVPGARAILLGFCGAALGWVVPSFLLSVRVTKRQQVIQKLIPDAVDLLVICVEAGLGLNQALQRVTEELRHTNNPLTTELAQMNLEVRAGTPRDQALVDLADRTGVADLRSLATMLIQTDRFGTSIADSLRVHAETVRVSRQQRAEEAAAKTTIKLVLPLALCILPALLVVILGPVLIQVYEALQGVGG